MLKRKIEDTLNQWKNTAGHKPLMIMGIRQCGKTFIAQQFAAANYTKYTHSYSIVLSFFLAIVYIFESPKKTTSLHATYALNEKLIAIFSKHLLLQTSN